MSQSQLGEEWNFAIVAHLFPGWLLTNREPVRAASHNCHGEECQGDVWDSHHASVQLLTYVMQNRGGEGEGRDLRSWGEDTSSGIKMKKRRAMEVTEQSKGEQRRGISESWKNTASNARLFLSCQQRAFGVIRQSATDPGPGHWQAWSLPASCQRTAAGEAAGLRGRIRPRAGSVKPRQPPVTHAQSLQPPIILQGCVLLATAVCVCLETGSGYFIYHIGNFFFTLNYYKQ